MRRLALATRLLLAAGILAAVWQALPAGVGVDADEGVGQRAALTVEADNGLFPSSSLLAQDTSSPTGWRVASTGADGFDVNPLVRATFKRPLGEDAVPAALFTIVPLDGSAGIGVHGYLLADGGRTVAGRPSRPLDASAVYELRVQAAGGERPRTARFVTTAGDQTLHASGTSTAVVDRLLPIDGPLEIDHQSSSGGRRYVTPAALDSLVTAHLTDGVQAIVLLPRGSRPSGGWPFVVFAHGLQRDRWRSLDVAGEYLAEGLAVVAPDVAMAAPSRVVLRSSDGSSVMEVAEDRTVDRTPLADEVAVGAQRLVSAASGFRGLDVDADGSPDLGEARGFHGESFGGPQAVLAARSFPELRLVLSSAVGDLPATSSELRPLRATLGSEIGDDALLRIKATTPGRGQVAILDRESWQANLAWSRAAWDLRRLSPEVNGGVVAPDRVLVQSALADVTVRPSATARMVQAAGWTERWWHVDGGVPEGADPHALLSWSGPARRQAATFMAGGASSPSGLAGESWVAGMPKTAGSH